MPRGLEADPKRMSFLDHLAELRMLLIHAAVFIVLGMAITWMLSGRILDWLIGRLGVAEVQFLSPMEPFNARLLIAAITGTAAALPLVALRIWAFIVPALRLRERRIILPSALSTALLFAGGVAFAAFVMAPLMMRLFLGFSTERVTPHLALMPLLSFVLRMSLACGLLFQLPLVLALTTFVGITSPRVLWSKWRHAVVAIFVVSAVVTPGDGPSQVVLAVPLIVLYFASVLVSFLIWRRREVPARSLVANEADAGPKRPDPPANPPRTPRPPPIGTQGHDLAIPREGDPDG
jgi:sec-independent protein translocase protein TatC